MRHPEPVFALPATPAAKCLFLMRQQSLTTRTDLADSTGLSQPTITRAITALLDAGLVTQRLDLTQSHGRGRPTVPLQVAGEDWTHAGLAVGTHSTYIGLFDVRGRTIREIDIELPIADMHGDDVIEHLIAGLNRLTAGLSRPLRTVGVTFPGFVRDDGRIHAPSLGWDDVDIAARLRYQFFTPATISAAVPAFLGAELQDARFTQDPSTALALFADDSIGAAVSGPSGVTQVSVPLDPGSILPTAGLLAGTGAATLSELVEAGNSRELLDARVTGLGHLAADLIAQHSPSTLVVAGSAFIDDPLAPGKFARTVRSALGEAAAGVSLRLIPTHREFVRAIARAVALDHLLRDPLSLA